MARMGAMLFPDGMSSASRSWYSVTFSPTETATVDWPAACLLTRSVTSA